MAHVLIHFQHDALVHLINQSPRSLTGLIYILWLKWQILYNINNLYLELNKSSHINVCKTVWKILPQHFSCIVYVSLICVTLIFFNEVFYVHDDVIKWKHFPRNWPFVRGIQGPRVNSPQKGQWRGALMFSLICVWIRGWVNTRKAGDLMRYRAHYDVIVMLCWSCCLFQCQIWHVMGDSDMSGIYTCSSNGPLARYVILCVGHAPGTFSPATVGYRSRQASRHVRHAHAVMHAGIANWQFPLRSVTEKTFQACATHSSTYLVRGSYMTCSLVRFAHLFTRYIVLSIGHISDKSRSSITFSIYICGRTGMCDCAP